MMHNGRWLASGLLLLASVIFSENVLAVPAAPIVHELIQPDGSRFQAKKWGDEWSHGWETVAGYTIMQDAATKAWVYAASDADGKMVPTAPAVGADAVPLNTPKYLRPAGKSSSKALQMSAEPQIFLLYWSIFQTQAQPIPQMTFLRCCLAPATTA